MTQVSVSSIFSVLHLFPIGIVVGIISALLGIGGGLLYVPALATVGASPIQSVATSLVAITLGANSGARLLPKLSDNLVRYLFTCLLVILAGYMSLKALEM